MVSAWRIVRGEFADAPFSGIGAELYGGRWNSPGRRVAYAAGSLALAAMETLVHLPYPAPPQFHELCNFQAFQIEFEENLLATVAAETLPFNWDTQPPPPSAQAIGNLWLEKRNSMALEVPSTLVPMESNYLINPSHPSFVGCKVTGPTPFVFDQRFRH